MLKYIWVLIILAIIPFSLTSRKYHNVVILQHQTYPDYDLAKKSFIYHLPKLVNIHKIYEFNAKSNLQLLDGVIDELANRKDIDLYFVIGTHSTIRVIDKIKKTPIVFTMCSDPVHAGIVKDWKTSNANYTGIETPDYHTKVIKLLHEYISFKRLGMIYLEGSPSHEATILQIKKLSREMGFELVDDKFSLRKPDGNPFPAYIVRENLKESLEKVCPKVDAFFVQSSNTFNKNFDIFRDAFSKYKIISAGDTVNLKKGVAIGINRDAYRFGRQAAQYAAKILKGTNPKSLPMDVGNKMSIGINLTAFKMAGKTVPFALITGADEVVK